MTTKAPKTIEEMVTELEAIEEKLGTLKQVPYEESVLFTHEFMKDLCLRLVALDTKQAEREQTFRDIAETLASAGVCRFVRPNGTDCFCAELCQPCTFTDAIERLQNS